MHSKLFQLILITIAGLVAFGCGGGGRVLSIKSDPADADVCIKGKARSGFFSNQKSCVGTTPFEAEKVSVVNRDGERHSVSFKDVEGDKESFYVIVSRPGYISKALEVPEWEHEVRLVSETQAQTQTITPVSASVPVAEGEVRLTSEPVGALVYINGALKGNTPFVYKGPGGVVRMKLELHGHEILEKAVTVEPSRSVDLNFKLNPMQ